MSSIDNLVFVSEFLVGTGRQFVHSCLLLHREAVHREAVVAPPARAVNAVKKAGPGAPPPPPASLGAIPKKTRVG